ncbi:periplasmic heavy metal sensor [Tropicibacter sp. S64]|uniref:periplasmic heavy metal sensor n=1 Tax=Tropicibacter sp. S64 TaxID=3415122 RepID=UPI003C7D63FB
MTDLQPPPPPGKPPRTRPWLRALLFVSLALNLVVVGLAVGLVLRGGPPHPPRGGADYVIPYTRALDEDQRRAVWRDLRQDFRDKRRQDAPGPDMIADYRDALDVLRADPFDPAAMMAVLERQTARATDRQVTGQKVLSAYLASLSPTDRAAYAARLAQEIDQLEQRRNRWREGRTRDDR